MQTHTFIIVGAGPAGLQAGICLQEKGADYVILERTSAVGSHFRNYPRHRQLISINKKYTGSDDTDFNLRHDWNSLLTTASQQKPFTAYSDSLYPSADTLVEYLEDVEKTHSLNIQFNTDISHISRDSNGQFKVETSSGVYLCSYLFMATGGSPWYPPIQGTEYSGIDTYENVSLDKSLFRNKKVLILGKGNSAFECAEYLSDTAAIIHLVSPRQISFAWNSRYVGDLRAVRNNFLDMYQLKSQFAILNANISRIEHIQGEKSEFEVDFDFTFTPEDPNNSIRYDKIIACTGFRYIDQEMFDQESIPFEIDRRPELKSKFPKITPEWEFSGVPRLYALGALMQTISYRKNAGGFIHGFRYTIRTLVDILFHREFGDALPSTDFESLEHSKQEIVRRINSASSLYQMYGELCDVIVRNRGERQPFTYYYDLPVSYIDKEFRGKEYVSLSFSVAPRVPDEDAFRYIPVATPSTPELSVFIHPVLRSCSPKIGGMQELHLLENIDINWSDPKLHIEPIWDFLQNHLAGPNSQESSSLDSTTEIMIQTVR